MNGQVVRGTDDEQTQAWRRAGVEGWKAGNGWVEEQIDGWGDGWING